MERSSINLATPTPSRSEYDVSLLSVPNSRRGSSSNLEAMRRGALPGSTRGVSLYDPSNPRSSMDLRPESSLGGHTPNASGTVRYLETETTTGGGIGSHSGGHQASESVISFNDDHRHR